LLCPIPSPLAEDLFTVAYTAVPRIAGKVIRATLWHNNYAARRRFVTRAIHFGIKADLQARLDKIVPIDDDPPQPRATADFHVIHDDTLLQFDISFDHLWSAFIPRTRVHPEFRLKLSKRFRNRCTLST
jgi:hypothetical protein